MRWSQIRSYAVSLARNARVNALQETPHALHRHDRYELDPVVVYNELNLLPGSRSSLSRISFGITTWNFGETVTTAI